MARMTTNDNDNGAGMFNLPDGEYHFKVLPYMETLTGKIFKTTDKRNDDNNDQIQLILKVGDKNDSINMFETLTFSKKAQYRIRQFLLAVGAYPGHGIDIELDAEKCIGLSGKCTVKNIEKKNSKFEKTVIDEWIEATVQNSSKIEGLIAVDMPEPANVDEPKAKADAFDDDVPF